MHNGAIPNGTVVVPEISRQKWVVQKFGGESVPYCVPDRIAKCPQVRAWENFQRT